MHKPFQFPVNDDKAFHSFAGQQKPPLNELVENVVHSVRVEWFPHLQIVSAPRPPVLKAIILL